MEKTISLLVCCIIATGFYVRDRKRLHISLMSLAFAIDLALLLYIELTRQAVKTAIEPPHPFVTFHVLISVGTMLLYLVQIGSGIGSIKGWIVRMIPHRVAGMTFLVFRGLNFATSLFLANFIRHV